jgi:hypothetical protein
VVVNCASAGRVKIGRVRTAKDGDTGKSCIDVVLGDGSWLCGIC